MISDDTKTKIFEILNDIKRANDALIRSDALHQEEVTRRLDDMDERLRQLEMKSRKLQ